MVQRLTYRRRHPYNTRSNRVRKVKTPGGKLVFQYMKKPGSLPKCPLTGQILHGLPARRPAEMRQKRLPRRHKSVSRIYGGKYCHKVVRERIIRAFLLEEQKIVKQVRKLQAKKGD